MDVESALSGQKATPGQRTTDFGIGAFTKHVLRGRPQNDRWPFAAHSKIILVGCWRVSSDKRPAGPAEKPGFDSAFQAHSRVDIRIVNDFRPKLYTDLLFAE